MRYNLSDIERTLLSAYMDGELSTVEVTRAEALLASSEEARSYLRELRAVDTFSGQALTAPATGGTVAGTAAGATAGGSFADGFSSKLSGSAIEAAAEKAMLAKAVTVGSWGLAGVIGTAAAVAVGVALSLQAPSPSIDRPIAAHERPAVSAQKSESPSVQPVVNLDTNNLIVPPMTTSDLLAFAMHGTLPIDADRSRFITLEQKGKDSLAVQVHNNAPRDIDRAVATIDISQARVLDSIEQVIRTSLIHSKRGIALRADIPSLRLGAIRSFEAAAPRMPVQMREQLDRCREQLNAGGRMYGEGSGNVTSLVIDNQIVYCVIPDNGFLTVGDEDVVMESPKMMLDFDNGSFFAVDQHALRMLQAQVRDRMPIAPVPPIGTPAGIEPDHHVAVGNPAGGKMVKKRLTKQAPSTVVTVQSSPEGNTMPRFQSVMPPMNNDMRVVIRRNDTLLIRADQAMREAEEHMQRVDSLMQLFREKLRKQLYENKTPNEDPQGSRSNSSVGTGTDSDD